ncbi:4Fe-4S cluster-binding domain-containing protein, partial [Staphylococcus epidermidis]|uniref:4Fe-4S cluster-binding domain-containing protein n=1 Tax=Staphylococcus epidermidis TaxID=1282 RepID=UPI0011A45836
MLEEILHYSPPSYIRHLTILAAQPFSNFFITLQLLQPFTQPFPHTKTISLSTPFLFQYFKHQHHAPNSLLQHIHLLLHPIFIQHLYPPNLPYKPSLNQRLIHLQSSL